MYSNVYSCFIAICISLASCSNNDFKDIHVDSGEAYFPVDSGLWFIHNVQEIHIDVPVSKVDTYTYQVKTVYSNQLNLNDDIIKRRVETFYRFDTLLPWQYSNVYFVEKSEEYCLVVEDNETKLVQKYPLFLDKVWNGHIYSNQVASNFKVSSIDKGIKTSLFNFDSVLSINELYDSSLIHLYNKTVYYAKGIGMVMSVDETIESQNYNDSLAIDMTKPIRNRIVKGTIIKKQLVGYDKL